MQSNNINNINNANNDKNEGNNNMNMNMDSTATKQQQLNAKRINNINKKKQQKKSQSGNQPAQATSGVDVNLSEYVEVFAANSDAILCIPREDIVSMPTAAAATAAGSAADNNAAPQKLQLCPRFNAEAPTTSCKAAANNTCKFVHAITDNAVVQDIHVNYAWPSAEAVYYQTFPAGEVLHVAPPNEQVAKDEIPSHLVLKTKALESNRRVISHCAHYYFNRTCNRGSACYFVHAVSLAASNSPNGNNNNNNNNNNSKGQQKQQLTEDGYPRRAWGRTQTLKQKTTHQVFQQQQQGSNKSSSRGTPSTKCVTPGTMTPTTTKLSHSISETSSLGHPFAGCGSEQTSPLRSSKPSFADIMLGSSTNSNTTKSSPDRNHHQQQQRYAAGGNNNSNSTSNATSPFMPNAPYHSFPTVPMMHQQQHQQQQLMMRHHAAAAAAASPNPNAGGHHLGGAFAPFSAELSFYRDDVGSCVAGEDLLEVHEEEVQYLAHNHDFIPTTAGSSSRGTTTSDSFEHSVSLHHHTPTKRQHNPYSWTRTTIVSVL